MKHANRSFWSFLTKSRIHLAFYDPPSAFADSLLDLAVRINAAPPCTPITVVWNQDLPHLDTTWSPPGRGRSTPRRVLLRPFFSSHYSSRIWFSDGLAHNSSSLGRDGRHDRLRSPRIGIFRHDWEHAGKYSWELPHGKWFRQVLPVGSQIDLILTEIHRYGERHVCKLDRTTLSSTGFHFTDEEGNEDFIRPVGFIPTFQTRDEEDVLGISESVFGVSLNTQDQAPDILDGNSGKATRFQRAPDSTESLDDRALTVGSSPWRPV